MKPRFGSDIQLQEPRFEAIFQAEPECVKVLDLDGRILQMNPAGLGILEAKCPEDVVGRTIFEFVEPSQREDLQKCFSRALNREHVTCSFEAIGLRGSRRWVELHMVALQSRGRPVEVLAVSRDITKEKLTQNALRTSEERFRLIVENSSDLIAELTTQGKFIYINPTFLRAIGSETAGIIDSSLKEWMHPEDLPLADRILESATAATTFRFRREDGSWLWMEASSRHFRDSGERERLTLIMRDVTRRVESKAAHDLMEMRLQQAQKMEALGTLAGGIAHDFNNILAAIIGYAEMARMSLPGDHPAAEALRETLKASNRATDLVRQILTFSRQEKHERKAIAIFGLVFEVVKLLRAALPSSIEIRTSVAPGLPNILADASQIHQVLMNLTTNAAHAMRKQGGVLEIDAQRLDVEGAGSPVGLDPGTYLQLKVRDTGEGMAEETIRRIFEPFFTTKPAGEGTGLGLSVVHGIVKSHEGSISVTSRPGMGSCFDIYFPAVEEGATSLNVGREVPMGNGEKVLYVDDEMALCRLVERSLARCGYRGVTRNDPLEALRMFVEDPTGFAAVITDFTMPKMSGLELTAEIRKVSMRIPVIITTGFTGSLDLERIKLSGVTEVLPKPFTMQRLAECLHAALAPA